MSYYDLLSIASTATTEEVKKAYRKKALQLHPDRNPQGEQDGHKEFRAVSEAYEVLKDPGKRATYDAIKDGFPGRTSSPYSEGTATYTETSYTYYKPSGGTPEQDPFDEFFAKWWAKREHEFRGFSHMEEEVRRERRRAEHMARAAAWQLEKEEAEEAKARHQRVKAKAQQARAARQAATLRKFWHTHSGVTWQDAVLVSLFTGSMLGLGYYWAPKKAVPPMAEQDPASGH
ncbi:hypothetical protein ABBQ32_001412 [Trebouxia sp. C0010 RCD-2024]